MPRGKNKLGCNISRCHARDLDKGCEYSDSCVNCVVEVCVLEENNLTPITWVLEMPYTGKELSVNYYKVVGKGGKKTNATRPDVKRWMVLLAERAKSLDVDIDNLPLTIELEGRFDNSRVPDLHNLHKVVGDALRDGLGVDDRHFKFVDIGSTIDLDRPPILTIKIRNG